MPKFRVLIIKDIQNGHLEAFGQVCREVTAFSIETCYGARDFGETPKLTGEKTVLVVAAALAVPIPPS